MPESLATKVLRGCYFREGNFLNASKISSASFVWNSLMWGKDVLDAGLRWRVGGGSSIHIYKDRWVPRPSTFKILSPPSLGDDATVDKLISPLGGWNCHLLKQHFSLDDYRAVLQISIGSYTGVDSVLWQNDQSGRYTVKSGYRVSWSLSPHPSSSNSSLVVSWWIRLWGLAIPLKIKIFVWKACHDWIPTMANLARRDAGMLPCVLESDAAVVVKWIKEGSHLDSLSGLILVEILGLLSSMGDVPINFVPRLANQAAHCLAKYALTCSVDKFWMEDFPPSVGRMVEADTPMQFLRF
ncbi:hypothetical protein Dsin_016656 [Dipteronia sinensis]|uniref:RNase H type-1 domain-containing protein n=1 Tax=Dipteronia sinensis TaxID=43782 RepID=A0AAE0ADI1_9ROSI|nr:hypothetical protein Dsin_016656 [Dipteronia sinensis]